MSALRILVVAVLLVLSNALPAASQQHWAVGVWQGNLGNLPATNRYGPERTLDIKSVSADGKGQATWTSAIGTQAVTLSISGNEMTFSTTGTSGASYKLTHKAGVLDGSWTPNGGGRGGGNVNLKKK
jgi:hypothetical protein